MYVYSYLNLFFITVYEIIMQNVIPIKTLLILYYIPTLILLNKHF